MILEKPVMHSLYPIFNLLQDGYIFRAPTGHVSTRISHAGSKLPNTEDTRNHVL